MSANYDSGFGGSSDALSPSNRAGSMRSLSEQSGKVAEEIGELGRVAVSQAGEVASNLRVKGERALHAGAERAKQARKDFEGAVSANPMKSVLIAAGVGIAIGYLLRRR
jgi:ElaB/YqjD/DUF883 family membrane-anchored ribosome-binding protein